MSLINLSGLSDEQRALRESVLQLLQKHLPEDLQRELDAQSGYPQAAFAKLGEAGYLGLIYPARFGGSEGSSTDLAVLVEALAYHHRGIASAVVNSTIAAGLHVLNHASPDVLDEVAPRIVDGTAIIALAMSEPGTGSDVAGLTTRAVRDGSDYLISGAKTWITCAHVATHLVVIARTDQGAERHRGLTAFLVPADSPGVTIRPLSMLGSHTTHPNDVFLDDVRVPATSILGEEGGAWRNIMSALGQERLGSAALSAGVCLAITEYAINYAKQRVQFGQPISDFQVIKHKLVDMWMMTEGARQATYRAAELLDAGQAAIREVSYAKIVATENSVRCADTGVQVMGGAGYSNEFKMATYFRDTRVATIGAGSTEIQKNIIAKQLGF